MFHKFTIITAIFAGILLVQPHANCQAQDWSAQAEAALSNGDYTAAISLFDKALKELESQNADPDRIGRSKLRTGYAHFQRGKSDTQQPTDANAARTLYIEAIALFESTKNKKREADASHYLGSWYVWQRVPTAAIEAYLRAIELYCELELYGPEEAERSLGNYLSIYTSAQKRALEENRKEIRDKLLAALIPFANRLDQTIAKAGGRWKRSPEMERKIEDLRGNKDLPRVGLGGASMQLIQPTENNRLADANEMLDRREFATAKKLFEEELIERQNRKGAEDTAIPTIKAKLSVCYLHEAATKLKQQMNADANIIQLYQRSLALIEEAIRSVRNRAAWGAPALTRDERLVAINESREFLDAYLSHYFLSAQPVRAIENRPELTPQLRQLLKASLKKIPAPTVADVYEEALNWKGLSLVVERNWARLVQQGGQGAEYRSLVEQLNSNLGDLQTRKRLQEIETSLSKPTDIVPRVKVQALQQKLQGKLLLDIYEFSYFDPMSLRKTKQLVAFVVSEKDIFVEWIGASDPIDDAVFAWIDLVVKNTTAANRKTLMHHAQMIADRFWLRVEPHLHSARGSKKPILISAEGSLAQMPFGALPTSDGRFLIEDYEFGLMPMPRLLVEAAMKGKSPSLYLANILGSYDLLYDFGRIHLKAFPKVADSARKALRTSNDEKEFVNAKQRVVSDLAARECLVFVAHGVPHFEGGIYLKPGYPPGKDDPPPAWENALFSHDIVTVDGRQGDLVVMLVCGSGKGEFASGEWILGLQRAFLVSGFRSSIGSLYEVDVENSKKILGKFLDFYWRHGMSKIKALHMAQLDFMRSGAGADHPAYWAPMVLSGLPD